MSRPDPVAGFTVESARAWRLRCNGCGHPTAVIPESEDTTLAADAAARAHVCLAVVAPSDTAPVPSTTPPRSTP